MLTSSLQFSSPAIITICEHTHALCDRVGCHSEKPTDAGDGVGELVSAAAAAPMVEEPKADAAPAADAATPAEAPKEEPKAS